MSRPGLLQKSGLDKASGRIVMEVIKVEGEPESFTFVNTRLKQGVMQNESFAACILSMNVYTHVRLFPALQTQLWASCSQRLGMTCRKGKKISRSEEGLINNSL